MSDFIPVAESTDDFDALLRAALADRAEPATATDFAARVLATAMPSNAIVRQPSVWPLWAAAIAMAVVVAFGTIRLMDLGTATVSTDTSFADSLSSDTTALLPIGLIVFMIAIAWAVARAAFASPEPEFTAAM